MVVIGVKLLVECVVVLMRGLLVVVEMVLVVESLLGLLVLVLVLEGVVLVTIGLLVLNMRARRCGSAGTRGGCRSGRPLGLILGPLILILFHLILVLLLYSGLPVLVQVIRH